MDSSDPQAPFVAMALWTFDSGFSGTARVGSACLASAPFALGSAFGTGAPVARGRTAMRPPPCFT